MIRRLIHIDMIDDALGTDKIMGKMCEEESVLISTLRRVPVFKGKREGIRRLAKRNSIEVESRIVLISGPRHINCV